MRYHQKTGESNMFCENPAITASVVSATADFSKVVNCRENTNLGIHQNPFLPRTRYYGSKRRIAPWIMEIIGRFDFHTCLDPFGGTGSISFALSQKGKQCTYHDGLSCNTTAARALFSRREPLRLVEFRDILLSVKRVDGFISRTFDQLYYTRAENQWLDGAAEMIAQHAGSDTANILSYCLFQACLQKRPFNLFHRANLNLRTRKNINRTFGNLKTWNESFCNLMTGAFHELVKARQVAAAQIEVLSPRPVLDLPIGFDLVYIDPPYLSEQRNELYIDRYHFLEGIANYKNWADLLSPESKIKSLRRDYMPEMWEDKIQMPLLLSSFLEAHRASYVALSYVDGGHPSISHLLDIFKSKFTRVYVHRRPLTYAMSKRTATEVLIIGEPK